MASSTYLDNSFYKSVISVLRCLWKIREVVGAHSRECTHSWGLGHRLSVGWRYDTGWLLWQPVFLCLHIFCSPWWGCPLLELLTSLKPTLALPGLGALAVSLPFVNICNFPLRRAGFFFFLFSLEILGNDSSIVIPILAGGNSGSGGSSLLRVTWIINGIAEPRLRSLSSGCRVFP